MGAERLSSEVQGAIARNAFVSAALEAGFDVYLPVCGGGADVILARKEDAVLRPVILRQTWSADDAIEDEEQWIGFEAGGRWHVAPNGPLLHIVTCRLPDCPDQTLAPVDLGQVDRTTLDDLEDYLLRPVESWPPLHRTDAVERGADRMHAADDGTSELRRFRGRTSRPHQ